MDYLSLCLICKDENDYLAEWLDYHILMGVDRFYIFDNESKISLRETLKSYTERGWVVVVDFPGGSVQLFAYDACLRIFGKNSRWIGFIDTDEFLVPKSHSNLKDLLKEFEPYAGLAVSSLFFGTNAQRSRPEAGQIASYTLRTHPSFFENEMVKSIVQPARVLMPSSPHDFVYAEGHWCVNERGSRVDRQSFPNHIEKIQLNHYFCRSESEIEAKLSRGRGDDGAAWPRRRFEVINAAATFPDHTILERAASVVGLGGPLDLQRPEDLGRAIAAFAAAKPPSGCLPAGYPAVNLRKEVAVLLEIGEQIRAAEARRDYAETRLLLLSLVERFPERICGFVDLASRCLELNDPQAAWQALSEAWRRAPNSYYVLQGMAHFFLRTQNYAMAEKTCALLLEISPRELTGLGFLTEALIGQGRFEEALKIGLPVVELSSFVGELPEGMNLFLIRKLGDILRQREDYPALAALWQAGVRCQPGTLEPVVELIQALVLNANFSVAKQLLAEAILLAPDDPRLEHLALKTGLKGGTIY